MNAEELLNMSLGKLSDEFEAFDGNPDFEAFCFEVENALSQKFDHRTAKAMARKTAKAIYAPTKQLAAKQIQAAANYGGGLPTGVTRLAANFTIVTKITALNIDPATGSLPTFNMPLPIFGFLDFINDYQTILNGQNPYTGSFRVTTNSSDVIVNYYDSLGTTKLAEITISCIEYPYLSFLYATISNRFKMSKVRLSLSDASKLSQFATQFKPRFRSMFGIDNSDTLTINSQKSPMQFQNGIIDVDGTFGIDKERCIMLAMDLTSGLNFSVSYSMFVEKIHADRIS